MFTELLTITGEFGSEEIRTLHAVFDLPRVFDFNFSFDVRKTGISSFLVRVYQHELQNHFWLRSNYSVREFNDVGAVVRFIQDCIEFEIIFKDSIKDIWPKLVRLASLPEDKEKELLAKGIDYETKTTTTDFTGSALLDNPRS